ncbi:MAG: GTPase HflX [Nitrospira sp. BO4]|jgi:GTP-binding protein HflX|nr:GTPase HflX [Nitrospira sp. BO4]
MGKAAWSFPAEGRQPITDIRGHLTGLRAGQVASLERLYRRRVSNDKLISPELAKAMAQLTLELRRPLGVLLTRRGQVQEVIVGTELTLSSTTLTLFRAGTRSLRGLRFIRTQLHDNPLNQELLTDLAFLRLDLVAVLSIEEDGRLGNLYMAHLLPPNSTGQLFKVHKAVSFHNLTMRFDEFIDELEAELQQVRAHHAVEKGKESAILVSASVKSRTEQEEHLAELAELATSADVTVIDRMTQRTGDGHQRYLLGSGKMKDVLIQTLHRGADMVIFDQTLSPAQLRAILEMTDIKVIDRTQLILDIFARRAHSREGKVQVELAQLRYLLPRLSGKGTQLSRLGGGIGTRGPGETKLETDRRRVRDRITHLERELEQFTRHQDRRRSRRGRYGLPVVSLVGYTNAGKSTLLNVLTKSQVSAQNRLFETLDTTSRRLRFPEDREIIITDTVGFIRDLPQELVGAFRTTLDELREADLLLHVVDISAADIDVQITAVVAILEELQLMTIPRLLVFNKCDQVASQQVELLCRRYDAIGISALQPATLHPLLARLEAHVRALPVAEDRMSGVALQDDPLALASRR